MKKSNAIKWIAVVFILIAMAVVVLCLTLTRPWTDDTKQRKNADAERIAHNEFLFDDVYFVSPAKSKYVKTSPYALFTCGEKNGKTCLLIVPSSPTKNHILSTGRLRQNIGKWRKPYTTHPLIK